MKVIGLNNKNYKLNLTSKATNFNDLRKKSEGHKIARQLLITAYPYDKLHEEVAIPGCSTSLYLDFFLPYKRIAFEVQGRQHKVYVPHFHGTPKGFIKQRKRDMEKVKWCEVNNITLVELDDERRSDWGEKILAATA